MTVEVATKHLMDNRRQKPQRKEEPKDKSFENRRLMDRPFAEHEGLRALRDSLPQNFITINDSNPQRKRSTRANKEN